jgi:AAA domain
MHTEGKMTIRNCKVVAIDGTHETGKSTLVAGLLGHLKSQGVNATQITEIARSSSYLEEAFFQPDGIVDIFTELSLFAGQIAEELEAARHHDVLICDRSVVNVLGYVDVYMVAERQTPVASYIGAMREFTRSYASIYDIVFYLNDRYSSPYADPYRPPDQLHREAVDAAVLANYSAFGIELVKVPLSLDLGAKVAWTAGYVFDLLKSDSKSG